MQIKIYATAIWVTDYFTQMQMTGKLLLMENVTQLKVVDISIRRFTKKKREYQQELHKNSDYQRKKTNTASIF